MKKDLTETTKMEYGKARKYEKETYETRKNDIWECRNVAKWINDMSRNEKLINYK